MVLLAYIQVRMYSVFSLNINKLLMDLIDMNWKINSFLPDVVQENFTVNNEKIK